MQFQPPFQLRPKHRQARKLRPRTAEQRLIVQEFRQQDIRRRDQLARVTVGTDDFQFVVRSDLVPMQFKRVNDSSPLGDFEEFRQIFHDCGDSLTVFVWRRLQAVERFVIEFAADVDA